MSNILLLYDHIPEVVNSSDTLKRLGELPVVMQLMDFHAEFLVSETFDLIIFELSKQDLTSLYLLQTLERKAITTGIDLPPIIIVADQGYSFSECALRTAKANFFFIRPVAEQDLETAIQQSLLP